MPSISSAYLGGKPFIVPGSILYKVDLGPNASNKKIYFELNAEWPGCYEWETRIGEFGYDRSLFTREKHLPSYLITNSEGEAQSSEIHLFSTLPYAKPTTAMKQLFQRYREQFCDRSKLRVWGTLKYFGDQEKFDVEIDLIETELYYSKNLSIKEIAELREEIKRIKKLKDYALKHPVIAKFKITEDSFNKGANISTIYNLGFALESFLEIPIYVGYALPLINIYPRLDVQKLDRQLEKIGALPI